VEIIKGNWGLEQITVRSTDVDRGKNLNFPFPFFVSTRFIHCAEYEKT